MLRIFLLVSSAANFLVGGQQCPPNYTLMSGLCIRTVFDGQYGMLEALHDAAMKECKKDGAVLPIIKSDAEENTQNSIFNSVTKDTVNTTHYFMATKPHERGFRDFDVGAQVLRSRSDEGSSHHHGTQGREKRRTDHRHREVGVPRGWQKVSKKMSQMNCSNNSLEATASLAGLKCLVFYSGIPKA